LGVEKIELDLRQHGRRQRLNLMLGVQSFPGDWQSYVKGGLIVHLSDQPIANPAPNVKPKASRNARMAPRGLCSTNRATGANQPG
jgi:hypothetical protein